MKRGVSRVSNNKNIKSNIDEALANENLRGALGRFGDGYLSSREKAYTGKDFEDLRSQIASVKGDAAERMEELAEKFTKNAESHGAKVVRAQNAEDARDYIYKLAQEKNAKRIVKSKSMASEEVHLNEFLNEKGIDTVETDLGEWILQLSGQKPSHMVMPAIHMTRHEVSDIFSKETRQELSPEISRLVQVSREEMREKFISADMGISGANIAVAESGTLVITTNEGNGRLAATLPPVHVAVVGLEKFVEKFADIKPILEALPRSATAQKITSYVSMITGPTQAVYPDGSVADKELHIVLLDNGRSEMQKDPVFKEALQCIRCASCLNVCPVFQLLGGHVFGKIYTGGIGTILTAFFDGMQDAKDIQNLCLGCEQCKKYCPANIDIPKLIRELRSREVEKNGLPGTQKFAMEKILPNRKLFHRLIKAGRLAQKPFQSGGKIRHLPMFLSDLAEGRSLPVIADKALRDRAEDFSKPAAPSARVAFFAGCLTDFVYPELGECANKVLKSMNIEMVFPQEQTCCGVPAIYMGSRDSAVKVAKQNIEVFEQAEVEHIITCCPTCAHALKNQYMEILGSDPQWSERVKKFTAKIRLFSEYVYAMLGEG
ncbi:MAG: LUD domain-containing protein, partial [Clostridiales bacterium]|nr:LUD domain-containing protein [Clostridiales bacterium]MCF8023758.1 LUD domain-containing protein [Clostridiales bacterium]